MANDGLVKKLKETGWIENDDGSFSKPKKNGGPDLLGPVAPDSSEPAPVRALDRGPAKHKSRKGSMVVLVTLTSMRKKLLDGHDAVAYSMKALTDAIARDLGIDDADPRICWEYSQQITTGEQGVMVKIERKIEG